MKQAMKKSMRRGAVILGVTALLGLFCSGCGGNRQTEQSGAASLSGETLIEIGPGEIAAAQTKDPADTQASQTEGSSTETLPESTQMLTESETEAVPEETSTETEPENADHSGQNGGTKTVTRTVERTEERTITRDLTFTPEN